MRQAVGKPPVKLSVVAADNREFPASIKMLRSHLDKFRRSNLSQSKRTSNKVAMQLALEPLVLRNDGSAILSALIPLKVEACRQPYRSRISCVDDAYSSPFRSDSVEPVEQSAHCLTSISETLGLPSKQPSRLRAYVKIGPQTSLEIGQPNLADHRAAAAFEDGKHAIPQKAPVACVALKPMPRIFPRCGKTANEFSDERVPVQAKLLIEIADIVRAQKETVCRDTGVLFHNL
ncbi:hypothetical protein K3M67_20030 (plasmid) [Sphingobium sp. V4]|nr:hypothetical protein [Sphingobium sp. V4]WIW90330.1 hypothetical protein K3M67_20030 [Sphingobium sp. V4]